MKTKTFTTKRVPFNKFYYDSCNVD